MSVGCVIAEVALGVPLLPGESEYNQVSRIHALLGAPPRALLRRCRRAEHFFVVPPAANGASTGTVPRLREERAAVEPALVRYLPSDDLGALVDSAVCI